MKITTNTRFTKIVRNAIATSALAITVHGGTAQNPCIPDGNKDELTTSYIIPRRVVWVSDDTGGAVRNPEAMLKAFDGQVAVNAGNVCTLSTMNGDQAAILLDFGKEYQGGIEIAAAIREDKKPVKIRVRYGESVSEAMGDYGSTATNDHAMRDFTEDIPWLGTVRTGESGFRFVRIDLLDENTELPLEAVRLVFRYRDIPYLGSFECDDQRLNDIWQTGAYTLHLNMQNYVWDGIKRDRLVWVGDLHPEVMCANTVFGEQEVVRKSLDFARDDTPLPGWMNGMCSYSLWWIIIHRDFYKYTGNLEYLKGQHEYLSRLVKQVIGNISGHSEDLKGGTRFLDWPTSENPEVIHAGLQAMMMLSLDAASELSGWLGDAKLKKECDKAVRQLSAYTPDDMGNKQAAALLGLSGLLTESQAAGIIKRDGAHGFSTFYGYYMLEALAAAGDYDTALDIIADYWGAMLDLGATTFWEDLDYADVGKAARIDELVPDGKYDIHNDGGAYCYVGLRLSMCHGWASGPTPWLTRHVLGAKPLEPGFIKMSIKPNMGKLTWVKGTVPTPYGVVKIEHRKDGNGKITTTYEAPQEIIVIVE